MNSSIVQPLLPTFEAAGTLFSSTSSCAPSGTTRGFLPAGMIDKSHYLLQHSSLLCYFISSKRRRRKKNNNIYVYIPRVPVTSGWSIRPRFNVLLSRSMGIGCTVWSVSVVVFVSVASSAPASFTTKPASVMAAHTYNWKNKNYKEKERDREREKHMTGHR